MKKAIAFLILFIQMAHADITVADTNTVHYLDDLECFIDSHSNNTYCIEPSSEIILLEDTDDIYTAVDNTIIKFQGYEEELVQLDCGDIYTNEERNITIGVEEQIYYGTTETLEPGGSIVYSEIGLTVKAEECDDCVIKNITGLTDVEEELDCGDEYYNKKYNITITDICEEGLKDYSTTLECGETYKNTKYDIKIETEYPSLGYSTISPSETKTFSSCGLTVTCTDSTSSSSSSSGTCEGETYLSMGQVEEVCGVTVHAPDYPNRENIQLDIGESYTDTTCGFEVSCASDFSISDLALESLNISSGNCSVNITVDGETFCYDDWKNQCTTDEILAGDQGLNNCFARLVTQYEKEKNAAVEKQQDVEYEKNILEQAIENNEGPLAVVYFIVIVIFVGFGAILFFIGWKKRNKKKIRTGEEMEES